MAPAKRHTRATAAAATLPDTGCAPGFAPWVTTTGLANGGDLAQMPKFNRETGGFSQAVIIRDGDAFELEPLTITDGPLRGSHVLVLKPFTKYFRFLELPLEIRRMIYDELLLETKTIQINSYKLKDSPRRAIGLKHYSPPGLNLSYASRFQPNSLAILAVSRQMLQEASPTLYGGNTFKFDKFSTCQIFLNDIGMMRAHIRHISFSGWAYQKTKARGMFFKLKDAIGLRSISLHYMDFTNWTADTLAADCKTMMTALQRSRKGGSSVLPVLDILRMTFSKCTDCVSPKEDGVLCTGCMKRSEKSSDLQGQIRQAVAERLGLEE